MVEQHIDEKQWDLFLKINNHRNTLLESKKLRLFSLETVEEEEFDPISSKSVQISQKWGFPWSSRGLPLVVKVLTT